MSSIATYIAFPGNAKAAFEYYHAVLGGELDLFTYGDMGELEMPFEPAPESVAHASLKTPWGEIAGGDAMDDREYNIQGSAYSLLVTLDDVAEARRLIAAFVDGGGQAAMPFELAPWGDHYGSVFDAFGVMWAFSVPAGA